MTAYRHIFGPVPSRRYGRSLGVDLSVPKTCSLDCRFCQLGANLKTTITRSAIPDINAVLTELRQWLSTGEPLDFITASGSGEPTLHTHFGDLFRFVKNETPCHSLLLTNGTLLTLPEVRCDAALADVVKLSLHAWDQASFEQITRPHPDLKFNAILNGYHAFRQQFKGRLDLEVFIIPGMNDAPEQVQRIVELARSFQPDEVTLNTAVRPPADHTITACPPEKLQALTALFGHLAQHSGHDPAKASLALDEPALVALIQRHPVTLATLAVTFKKTEDEMHAFLAPLIQQQKIRFFTSDNNLFVSDASFHN